MFCYEQLIQPLITFGFIFRTDISPALVAGNVVKFLSVSVTLKPVGGLVSASINSYKFSFPGNVITVFSTGKVE